MAKLSEASNIHILTNTGFYKEPFLPTHAFELSEEELAKVWIDEVEDGIGESRGGNIRKYSFLLGEFVPLLLKSGSGKRADGQNSGRKSS